MSIKIEKLDKNFASADKINEPDVVWRNVKEEPFTVYGLYDYKNQTPYKRMPESVARETSKGIADLNYTAAGGRIRFRTDSRYIALRAEMTAVQPVHSNHMLVNGFDCYVKINGRFVFYRSFFPPNEMDGGYETSVEFDNSEEREILIHFPIHARVDEVMIGLTEGACLHKTEGYHFDKPVVFYGSSITHGSIACRPGNSYVSMLSRWLDVDVLNFGFGGQCKGELPIVRYMASLPMLAFVLDYDHNAPGPEHLLKTHEAVYRTFREANPDVPILMTTRPDFYSFSVPQNVERRNVIYNTYINAVHAGDKNVWFLDGQSLWGCEDWDCCTTDGCHPNDIGHLRMAKQYECVLRKILY